MSLGKPRLGRLRFYCQMCAKQAVSFLYRYIDDDVGTSNITQCRDENGFKCHTQTSNHLRNMEGFASDASSILENHSMQFHKDFMALFSLRYASQRVAANAVYQDLISDPDHVHINATRFGNLSNYVKFLGREGHATVEQVETIWYIIHIDKSANALDRARVAERNARDAQMQRRERKELERMLVNATTKETATVLDRKDDGLIKLEMSLGSTKSAIQGLGTLNVPSSIQSSGVLNMPAHSTKTLNMSSKTAFKKPIKNMNILLGKPKGLNALAKDYKAKDVKTIDLSLLKKEGSRDTGASSLEKKDVAENGLSALNRRQEISSKKERDETPANNSKRHKSSSSH